ncbi:putative membrane protein [Paraburkholderia xenovorans LB400]|uniref:Transmembrane protein n=1 Tax=Paraburkholderia xenovorans (strain LB400) TaxID=266265 RepID=Q13PK8_PARXL|nr:membrane protein [Paraburkholderia xenovorans]ABE33981.1 Conserved hypothetical protein [Paraburkholderia xenovorans LB400]AIP36635.1 putative membrane protein [Paraburkholderia xenovorans LB400]
MNFLLTFAPFIAFAVIERIAGSPAGLIAGALVAAALLLRDFVSPTRHVKLLEVGTVLLFGALAVYALTSDAQWSIAAVRLRVDAGLTLIVLATIALRQPFTLQYARETVDREHWNSAHFLHVNYVISAAWAGAFAILVLADIAMAYAPAPLHSTGVIASVIALIAAIRFTSWYPAQYTARQA